MKLHRITQMIILAAWVLSLSVFPQAHAQQTRRGASNRKSLPSAPQVRFTTGESALKIPLELDGNIIFLRVSVNNSKPLKFIFDTGASHSVINAQRAAELGLKSEGQARGSATGGSIQGSVIKGVSLSVPGAEVSNQLMASLPFPASPVEFDGVIGYGFISQFIVEIDYRSGVMNLYNPRTYAYSGNGEIIPLLLDKRQTPLVHTKIIMEGRAPVSAELEVDTGADGTFVINSPFVRKQKLLPSIQKTVQGSGRGLGGEQQRLVGYVKAVQLGRFTFDNPPIGLSLDTEGSGASDENDGVIGGEIFRRFKVIIDYSRKRMILEPNESFSEPYEIERGGIAVGSGEDVCKEQRVEMCGE